jgi:hypothetical protein
MYPKIGQKAAVINFAAELLNGLEFDIGSFSSGMPRPLFLLVEKTGTDVCIMHNNEISRDR